MKILLPALALFVLQDKTAEVSVGKSEAAPYRAAVTKYNDARDALNRGDIQEAYDKALEIVEDTKIKVERRECRIKLQQSDSTWLPQQDFYPVFVKVGAMVALAKKQYKDGKKEDAVARLQAAAKDVTESVSRGVPGAADLEKEIKKLVVDYAPNEESPELKKKRAYDAKVKEALKAKDDDNLALAKQLFEDAIKIDPEPAEARDQLAKVEGLIKDAAAFATYKAAQGKGSLDEQMAACEVYLKAFPNGVYEREVRLTLDKLTTQKLEGFREEKRRKELAFRSRWNSLMGDKKFKQAVDHLKAADAPLEATELERMRSETLAASDELRDSEVDRLTGKLRGIDSLESVTSRSVDSINRDFRIPDESELINTHPSFTWMNEFKAALLELKKLGAEAEPAKIIDAVKEVWSKSVLLVEKGANPYFRAVESIVYASADTRMQSLVQRARIASTEDLKKIKEEANGLIGKIDELDGRLTEALRGQPDAGKAWRDENGYWGRSMTELKSGPSEFPRDAAEIEAALKALGDWEAADGTYGKSASSVLDRIERDLRNVERNIGRSLTRDAKRKLFTGIIIARSLRLFLDGKKVEDVAGSIGEFADELRKAGGVVSEEAAKFGPKVEKVFAAVK
jgi:tetratricopeptide (TPR) repeat protein